MNADPCGNCDGLGGWRCKMDGMREWNAERQMSVPIQIGQWVVCPVCDGSGTR